MSVRTMRGLTTRVALVAATFLATGCVYFNGVYNAKEAAHRGDGLLRRGDESGAATFFTTSATSAESVLARHPKSKWRDRALYLSGRGSALAGYCDLALQRLDEYLALPVKGRDSTEYNRARLAKGMCYARNGRIQEGRQLLDQLINVKEVETARMARLWASRAALAAKDGDAAERYLQGMNIGTMSWEILASSVNAHDYVRIESLLVQRARAADYRSDVTTALRELLNAGLFTSAEQVVADYDAARVQDNNRLAMHYLLGDAYLRSGRDTIAQRHLTLARQLAGRDSNMARETASRLTLLGIRSFESLGQLDNAFAQQDSAIMATAYSRRLREQSLLVKLLAQKTEPTGAALFLAGEVARDSLQANRIARTLFLRVARDVAGSPLAANALYAAALLEPDSAELWKQRIISEHPASNVAAWLRGEDPSTRADYATNAELLRSTWLDAVRSWADTVRKLRASGNGRGTSLPR